MLWPGQLRERGSNRETDDVPPADQIAILRIGQLEDVIGPDSTAIGHGGVCEEAVILRACCCSIDLIRALHQLCFHAGKQVACGERLDEVIVCGGREAFEPCFFTGASREHDHRNRPERRVCAQLPQEPEAIELGHHDVGHDHVRRARPRRPRALPAVADGLDDPSLGEQALRVVAHVGVVVGEENAADVDPTVVVDAVSF